MSILLTLYTKLKGNLRMHRISLGGNTGVMFDAAIKLNGVTWFIWYGVQKRFFRWNDGIVREITDLLEFGLFLP